MSGVEGGSGIGQGAGVGSSAVGSVGGSRAPSGPSCEMGGVATMPVGSSMPSVEAGSSPSGINSAISSTDTSNAFSTPGDAGGFFGKDSAAKISGMQNYQFSIPVNEGPVSADIFLNIKAQTPSIAESVSVPDTQEYRFSGPINTDTASPLIKTETYMPPASLIETMTGSEAPENSTSSSVEFKTNAAESAINSAINEAIMESIQLDSTVGHSKLASESPSSFWPHGPEDLWVVGLVQNLKQNEILNQVQDDNFSDIIPRTMPYVALDRQTDQVVTEANLARLNAEYQTLAQNKEVLQTKSTVKPEIKPVANSKKENDIDEDTKKLFKTYVKEYILPKVPEQEVQTSTTPKTESIFNPIGVQPEAEEEEETEINPKIEPLVAMEIKTDLEAAVRAQKAYVAVGVESQIATQMAVQALAQKFEQKKTDTQLEKQVMFQIKQIQKSQEKPLTETEVQTITYFEVKAEQKKKKDETPEELLNFAKDSKAEARRISTAYEVSNKIEQQLEYTTDNTQPKIISGEQFAVLFEKSTTEEANSEIRKKGPDYSLEGKKDGTYKAVAELKPDTLENIRKQAIQTIKNKPPVKVTKFPVNNVTERDVRRVVGGTPITIYQARYQKSA